MPRSFSRSLESIARSSTRWLSRKVPGLAEQLIDKGRLAVIDVGDDRHVAEAHIFILKEFSARAHSGRCGVATRAVARGGGSQG